MLTMHPQLLYWLPILDVFLMTYFIPLILGYLLYRYDERFHLTSDALILIGSKTLFEVFTVKIEMSN